MVVLSCCPDNLQDDRHEQGLTNSVELFWVTCSQMEEKGNIVREVSWLDYGHQGMQVWYSSHGENPFRQEDFLQSLNLTARYTLLGSFQMSVQLLAFLRECPSQPHSSHALSLLQKCKQYCIIYCGIFFRQSYSWMTLRQSIFTSQLNVLGNHGTRRRVETIHLTLKTSVGNRMKMTHSPPRKFCYWRYNHGKHTLFGLFLLVFSFNLNFQWGNCEHDSSSDCYWLHILYLMDVKCHCICYFVLSLET